MSENILITGGSGLLALNWALAIRDRFLVTLGLHNRDASLVGVKTRHFQLESVDQLVRTFEAVKPKAVIHTAGLTNVDECEVKPDLARHINVELAENVAKACSRLGVPLVHISTDHLFFGDLALLEEACPTAPRNVYGRTKAEAECRVLESHAQSMVIRTNFYGWGPIYRRSFSDIIIETLREGKTITLFKDVFYTPILIETLANVVHELIGKKVYGIFNVVGDERVSKYEFGLIIAKKFNLDSNLIIEGLLADQRFTVQRPKDMSLSNNKVCNLLGRRLGDVDEHMTKLYRQEQDRLVQEIKQL